jgi:hypothetical protein
MGGTDRVNRRKGGFRRHLAFLSVTALIFTLPVLSQKAGSPQQKVVSIEQLGKERIPEAPGDTQLIRAYKLGASDGDYYDNFGYSIDIDGSTAVMGAPQDDVGGAVDAGSVYVYVRSGLAWVEQAKLVAPDGAADDRFGHAVAVSGDTVVVGAPRADVSGHTNQGAVYVFTRNAGLWTQTAKLVSADGGAGDDFGITVAIDADTAVVGAMNHNVGPNTDQGAAYVFHRSSGMWSQQGKLTAADGDEHDAFGNSVAVAGDLAVVGAAGDDVAMFDEGSVHVFARSGSVWTRHSMLLAGDLAVYDGFGSSVALYGSTIIAGAPGDDIGFNTDQGSAYAFVLVGGLWIQQEKLVAFDGGADDRFGASVAIDGDTAVIGAPEDDVMTQYNQGSVYAWGRVGGIWGSQLKIMAADGLLDDRLGTSVGISGHSLIAGAPNDSTPPLLNEGSAYLVEFVPTTVSDFDGDGRTDMAIYRPLGGTGHAEWWFLESGSPGSYGAFGFGSESDIPVPADYTGDGATDPAFFRPSNGYWYILRSEDASFYAFPFGMEGDTPAPGDYDGDGRADAAVYRQSNGMWYGLRSSDMFVTYTQFGIVGDRPVVADYDGDGRDDIAVFRKAGAMGAEWWILRSTAGPVGFTFGDSGDVPVPGDYTGDRKADLAFFRPSTGHWYILRSTDHSFYAFPFGIDSDVPAPGDYDGDGKTDAAVYRAGQWFVSNSSTGTASTAPFGLGDDRPVPGILY